MLGAFENHPSRVVLGFILTRAAAWRFDSEGKTKCEPARIFASRRNSGTLSRVDHAFVELGKLFVRLLAAFDDRVAGAAGSRPAIDCA